MAFILKKNYIAALKIEYPSLSRKDFQEVISQLGEGDYVFEHGLIRRLPDKESEKNLKKFADKKPGKGDPESIRVPNKREV